MDWTYWLTCKQMGTFSCFSKQTIINILIRSALTLLYWRLGSQKSLTDCGIWYPDNFPSRQFPSRHFSILDNSHLIIFLTPAIQLPSSFFRPGQLPSYLYLLNELYCTCTIFVKMFKVKNTKLTLTKGSIGPMFLLRWVP